jgi:hypothetical protein
MKYKIMGWDTFSSEEYTIRDDELKPIIFKTHEYATKMAEKLQKEALKSASSISIADRYWVEEIE